MKLLRILLLAFPLLLIGAVLTPLPAYAQCGDQPQLVGTWEWVKTWGPPGWPIYTPASEGKTLQLEFMDSGELRHYENEQLVRVTSWQPLTCVDSGIWGYYWHLEAGSIAYFNYACDPIQVSSSGDEVYFMESCLDGMETIYVSRDYVAVSESTWGGIKRLYN